PARQVPSSTLFHPPPLSQSRLRAQICGTDGKPTTEIPEPTCTMSAAISLHLITSLKNIVLRNSLLRGVSRKTVRLFENRSFPTLEFAWPFEIFQPSLVQKRHQIVRLGIPSLSRSLLFCALARRHFNEHVAERLAQCALQ